MGAVRSRTACITAAVHRWPLRGGSASTPVCTCAELEPTERDAVAFELGCLFAEAVIERYGWRWVRIDDHACGVAAPKNAWLLDPTALIDDARTDPAVDLKARFDDLATLSPGTPGALRPLS